MAPLPHRRPIATTKTSRLMLFKNLVHVPCIMRNAQTHFVVRRQTLKRVVLISSTALQNVILTLRFTYAVRIVCCVLQRCRITAECVEALCTSRQSALLLQQDRKCQLRLDSLSAALHNRLYVTTQYLLRHVTTNEAHNYRLGLKLTVISSELVAKVVCFHQFIMIRLRRRHKPGLSVTATHDAKH